MLSFYDKNHNVINIYSIIRHANMYLWSVDLQFKLLSGLYKLSRTINDNNENTFYHSGTAWDLTAYSLLT